VPAAAVIPAPIAYIKVVAVKKLVVEFLGFRSTRSFGLRYIVSSPIPFGVLTRTLMFRLMDQGIYFEKIRVFQAGDLLEYISME
jgi:hypothetical protein